MDGEQRLIIILAILVMIIVSIVGILLLVVLWPYRVIIGLALVLCVVILFSSLVTNEQEILVSYSILREKDEGKGKRVYVNQ